MAAPAESLRSDRRQDQRDHKENNENAHSVLRVTRYFLQKEDNVHVLTVLPRSEHVSSIQVVQEGGILDGALDESVGVDSIVRQNLAGGAIERIVAKTNGRCKLMALVDKAGFRGGHDRGDGSDISMHSHSNTGGTQRTLYVYVAAPFRRFQEVEGVHAKLLESNMKPTSTGWVNAAIASGGQDLASYVSSPADLDTLQEAIAQNDIAISGSDIVIALCYPGEGRQMFAECELARILDVPVIFVASDKAVFHGGAYRVGALQRATVDEAIVAARTFARMVRIA